MNPRVYGSSQASDQAGAREPPLQVLRAEGQAQGLGAPILSLAPAHLRLMAAMKGAPMRVLQAILGHSSVNVTEIYAHLQPEVMTKAMHETFG